MKNNTKLAKIFIGIYKGVVIGDIHRKAISELLKSSQSPLISVLTEIHSELTDKEKQKNGLDNAEFSWKLAIENLGIIKKTNNVNPLMDDILKAHGLQ